MSSRVVAVLGYSRRRDAAIHQVCAERLSHAQALARDRGTVILSGEANLMRAAWIGPDVVLVCDTEARSTVENAVNVAAAARRLGASEVVVVTSRWHMRRARALLRAALRGTDVRLVLEAAPGSRPVLLVSRELAALLLLPLQLAQLRVAMRRS